MALADNVVPRYWDGSIKRRAAPNHVRRAIALRFGCEPGGETAARCAYCGAEGHITWFRLKSGKPAAWVHFRGLQLDHIHPYSKGGSNTDPDNFTLACKSCNASKCDRPMADWLGTRKANRD